MPRFNMSDDDTQALVNYFAAADRITNPGMGVQYPYFTIQQRDEAYMRAKNSAYVRALKKADKGALLEQRLKVLQPVWEKLAKDRIADLEERIKTADTKTKDGLQAELKTLQGEQEKKEFPTFRKQWEESEAYAVDAFRLVAGEGKSICLSCHAVGKIEPKDRKGPDLSLAWQRLRPEWTERWIANPDRFLTYRSIMIQNIKPLAANPSPLDLALYGSQFHGTPLEQVQAARDYLMMYPRVMDLPVVRLWPPPVYETAPADKK
jgi:hypothetical protein